MLEQLTSRQRMAIGLFFLLLVNILWVGSSELTEYIFKTEDYKKPYFSTYLKTAMFALYLSGFLFRRRWWQQCHWPKGNDQDGCQSYLTDPVYVPIKDDDDGYSSIDSNDYDIPQPLSNRRSVRFSDQTEVRCMTGVSAEEASLARLSYNEFMKQQKERAKLKKKFPVVTVCKLALVFCLLWFLANFSYQEALLDTEAGVVNILSSTSGLFTLILAAIWSSGPTDRLTLSKLLAVVLSISGTTLICLSEASVEMRFPAGAVWAIVSALSYAIYLISLKRKVKDDSQLDIPMFFGFVGLFNLVILWPGLFIFHYAKWELFTLPSKKIWLYLLLNGVVGTMLSELLWLWGCFLTSSLIGTLALSLTTPLTIMFDIMIKKASYTWMFYVGVAPVLISFIAVTLFSHWDNWDPALILLRKITKCITRAMLSARLREVDTDQTERLINHKDNV